jgi:hypothetical protein
MQVILAYLLEPWIFISSLALLFVLSIAAVFSYQAYMGRLRREMLHKDEARLQEWSEVLKENDQKWKKKLDERQKILEDNSLNLERERTMRLETEKQLKSLQDALAKMKNEISLQQQMNEGLKGQYSELERDYDRLTRRMQGEFPEAAAREPEAFKEPMN